jgi:hypothetical protein
MGNIKSFEYPMCFEKAVQLKIYEFNDEGTKYRVFGAVGWGDVVICMCCGHVFSIKDMAEEGYKYEILPWINLSAEVLGED